MTVTLMFPHGGSWARVTGWCQDTARPPETDNDLTLSPSDAGSAHWYSSEAESETKWSATRPFTLIQCRNQFVLA